MDKDVHHLLSQVGMTPESSAGANEPIPKFDAFRDPLITTQLGAALARGISTLKPDILVVWDGPDDSVLAHVVALELGVRWVRAFDDGGRIRHVGDAAGGSRVVLLEDVFRDMADLSGLHALALQQGWRVIGAAALVPSKALEDARGLVGNVVTCANAGGA